MPQKFQPARLRTLGDNMSESMGEYISESLGDFVGIGTLTEHQIAFVPGSSFYHDGAITNQLRLSYARLFDPHAYIALR